MYSQGYYQIVKPPRTLRVSSTKLTLEQQIISFWDHYQFDTEVSHTTDAFLTQLHDLIHNQKVHQTLQLVQETDFSPKLVFCLIQMAMQVVKKHPPSALLLLLGCEPLTVSFNQRQQTQVKMQIYNALGTYYRQTKEYQKALLEFERALIDIRNYKLKDIAATYLNMALLLRLIDQNQRALENSKKAVIEAHKQYLQKGTHVVVLAISFYIVGKQEQLQENNQQALQAFASGFKIVEDNLGEQHTLTRMIKQVYEEFARQLAILEASKLSMNKFRSIRPGSAQKSKGLTSKKSDFTIKKKLNYDMSTKKLRGSDSEKKQNFSLQRTQQDEKLYRSQQMYSEERTTEKKLPEDKTPTNYELKEEKARVIQSKWRFYQHRFKQRVQSEIGDGKVVATLFLFKGVVYVYLKGYTMHFLFYDLKVLATKRKKREARRLVIDTKPLQHIFRNKLQFEEMKLRDMLTDGQTRSNFFNLVLKKVSLHFDGERLALSKEASEVSYKTMVNGEKIAVTLRLGGRYNTGRVEYQIKNSELGAYQAMQAQYIQARWRQYVARERQDAQNSIPIKKYVRYQGRVVKQKLKFDQHHLYYQKDTAVIQLNIQTPHSQDVYDSLVYMVQTHFNSYWTHTTELNHVKFVYFLHKSLGTAKYILVRTTELIYNVIKTAKANYTITSQIALEPTHSLYHSKLITYHSNLVQAIQYPNYVLYWYFGTNSKIQLLPIFSMIPQHQNDLHEEVVFDFKNQKVFKLKVIVRIQQFLRRKHRKLERRRQNQFKVRYITLAENRRYILTVQHHHDDTQKLIVNEFPSRRKVVLPLDEAQFELIRTVDNPIALFDFDKQSWKHVEHQYYASLGKLKRLQVYYKDRHKVKALARDRHKSKFLCIRERILFSIRDNPGQVLLEACSLKARHYRQTLPISEQLRDALLAGDNPLDYIVCDLENKEMTFKGMQQGGEGEEKEEGEEGEEKKGKEEEEQGKQYALQKEDNELNQYGSNQQLPQLIQQDTLNEQVQHDEVENVYNNQFYTPRMGYVSNEEVISDQDSHGFKNEIVKSQESQEEYELVGKIKELESDLWVSIYLSGSEERLKGVCEGYEACYFKVEDVVEVCKNLQQNLKAYVLNQELKVYSKLHERGVVRLQRKFKKDHYQRRFKVKIPKQQQEGELFVGRHSEKIHVAVVCSGIRNSYVFGNEALEDFLHKVQIRVISNLKYSDDQGMYLLKDAEHKVIAQNLQASILQMSGLRFKFLGYGLLNGIYDAVNKHIIIASDDRKIEGVQIALPKETRTHDQIRKLTQELLADSFIISRNSEMCVVYYEHKDKHAATVIQRYLKNEYILSSFRLLVNLQFEFTVLLIQVSCFKMVIRIQNVKKHSHIDCNLGRQSVEERRFLKGNVKRVVGMLGVYHKANGQMSLGSEDVGRFLKEREVRKVERKEMREVIERMRQEDWRKDEDGIISEVQESEEDESDS